MYLPVVGTVPSLTFVESQNDGAPGAWGVIAADFNKDGMLDVVTANRGSNTVTVYLGNGNGTFQAGQQITVFTGPFGLAVGDINHDGNLDLVVTSLFASGSGGVAVLLGNGDGTFQSPTLFTTDHGQSLAAALADVNGDGNLDLIAGNATGGVAVFLGNGNGTFQAPVIYGSSLGQIGDIRVADLNGDGSLDLIVANESVVATLLGNGNGTFQNPASVSVPGSIGTVIGDFDGDGKLDAVASSFDSATVFLKGNGDGTFQTGVTIATSANRGIQIGDFNGDGKLDFVTQDQTGQKLDFYIGNGDGTFQAVQSFGTDLGPQFTFAVGNFVTGGGLAVAAAGTSNHMVFFQTAVVVSPAIVNFASLAIGTTSDPMTVTVTNSTPAIVNISDITISEAGSSVDFHQTSTTCGETLAVGASCTEQVTFQPTVAGPLSASVEVTDDAPGSPQSATLSGTGTAAPVATFSTTTEMFAAQGVGTQSAAQMVTLTNTGTAVLNIEGVSITGANASDFTQTNDCVASMAINAVCTFNVKFTPAAAGARSASIMIDDDAPGNPHSIALMGTGQVQPTAMLSANTLTFVATVSGMSSASQMVTVTNNGGTALAITSIALGGASPGDFTETSTCGSSLAASAICTITVTFKPTAGGARVAAVTMTDNAADSPQSIAVTNSTPAIVNISSITVSEAGSSVDFHQTSTTCTSTLAVGASCTVQVAFQPTVAGPLSASVEVTDDAPGSPQSATLSGTGTAAPVATFSTTTVTFAAQGVGTQSAAQMVTLTNTGTAVLNIEEISITGANAGDFTQTDDCVASMAVSAVCTFNVKFTPAAAGARSASITINDDASGNPHFIALIGTGQVQPTATLSANTLTFAATVSGMSSASQMVTVTNSGGTALAITSIALGGASPGDFIETSTCGSSLAASANCTITVTFKPTAGGARVAAVTLTDNAADSPQSIALNGTGEDFTLSVTTPTQTISRGGTANIQVAVTPQGGFTGLITLTCTGAPVHSTCSVVPSSFTATVTPTNVAVSLVTQGQMFAPPPFSTQRRPVKQLVVYPLALCVLVVALLSMAARKSNISFEWMRNARFAMVLAVAIMVGVFGLAGCGSTSGVVRGNVNLTITATSGGISHGAPITVIVQ